MDIVIQAWKGKTVSIGLPAGSADAMLVNVDTVGILVANVRNRSWDKSIPASKDTTFYPWHTINTVSLP